MLFKLGCCFVCLQQGLSCEKLSPFHGCLDVSWLERLDVLGQTDIVSVHIYAICNPVGLKRVLDEHQDLFKKELGLIKGVKAKIY